MIGRRISVGGSLTLIGLCLANCGAESGARPIDAGAGSDVGIQGEGPVDAMADDVPPQGCMATLVLPGNEAGCHASWVCDDGRAFSYACGGAADGGALCFCSDERGSHDPTGAAACGVDVQTLLLKVPGLCGWEFLLPPADGGPG